MRVLEGRGAQPSLLGIGKRTVQFHLPHVKRTHIWIPPLRCSPRHTPETQLWHQGARGSGFHLSNTALQPRPETPGAAHVSGEPAATARSTDICPPGCAPPAPLTLGANLRGKKGETSWSCPAASQPKPPNSGGGRPGHLPKLPKRPVAQHTRASTAHTKPTCCGSISRLPRSLCGRRGPGSAIPERLGALPG